MFSGKTIADHVLMAHGLGPVTPAASVPDYVSLKNAVAAEAVVCVLNGTTVTGSAITLLQAQAVANTGEKALGFTKYYANIDPVNSSAFTLANATSNTFTTLNTNSITAIYRIPIDPATLDVANSFDCVRVGTANATNTTAFVFYNIIPRYAGGVPNMPNVAVDAG